MLLRRCQIFVAFFGISLGAHAFQLSLKGGSTVTQHRIKFPNGDPAGGFSKGLGYSIGLGLDLGGQGLGIETDVFYTQRSSVPITFGDDGYVYKLNAIEIPVIMRLRIAYFQVGAGFYYSNKVGVLNIDGGSSLAARDYTYDELGLEEYQVGAVAAMAGFFPTESLGTVVLEARWNQSLSNRAKFPVGKTQFRAYSYDLLLGFAY
jgi:hypothetical protein